MAHQVALTILANIKPGEIDSLKRLLNNMRENVAGNEVLPFGQLAKVHFARFVVLDTTTDLRGRSIAPSLLFTSDADAPLEQHLKELVDTCGDGLDRIYGHCEGYPAPGTASTRRRLAYLRAHMVAVATNYVNTIGRTVQQVRHESQLRDAIQDFLNDPKQDWSARRPREMRAAIQHFVAQQDSLVWASTPAERPPLAHRLREVLHTVGVPAGLLLLSPIGILGFPAWLVLLRIHERTDPVVRFEPDHARIEALAALEDQVVQNPFSAVGYVKPGWFRQLTATGILWLANYVTRHIFNRGNLAGVKTIHFARWIFINQKRRLVFISNYDGSLESYMDDFIDKVAWGLNGVFSNGVGYPKTDWLLFRGARDEGAFKNFLHHHQVQTQVWYSAYPHLTTRNIENNARIREGLSGKMGDREIEAWLHRL